jgi:GNAT superfamily N-acetyltransferase
LAEPAVRLETIPLKHLEGFAQNAARDPAFAGTVPISLLRAASQAKNPHADPDDAALVLAYAGNRCVGYHGLLPGLLRAGQSDSKVYWLITLFVAPDFRGRGVGAALVGRILKLGADLVTTGITTGAERLYRACGFTTLGQAAFHQLRLERIPWPARHLAYAALRWPFSRAQRRVPWRPAPRVAGDWPRIGAADPGRPVFARTRATADWMIAHPWVVSRQAATGDLAGYHFSTTREVFRFAALEALAPGGGAPRGCAVLSASRHKGRGQVKLLDLFFETPPEAACAGLCAVRLAHRARAERIDLPAAAAAPFARPGFPARLGKPRRRLTLYLPSSASSPLAQAAGRIALDYCDSDTAFT